MIVFNPCKYCLSRPVCRTTCDDFEKYGVRVHDTLFISYMIVLAIVLLSFMIGCYWVLPNNYIHGILTVIVLYGYYHAAKEIKNDKDFPTYKWWQKTLLWVFGPFLLLTGITWDKIPIDKPIEDFIYKHIKRLQPERS